MIDTKELKAVLMPFAEEARIKGMENSHPVTAAHYTAMQRVLVTLLSFLDKSDKGETDMKKLGDELAVQIVKISEIEPRRRGSELEDKILAQINDLKQGQAALIDPEAIKFGHLSAKLSIMKKQKKLSDDIRVIKRKEKYYLAKI